MTGRGIAGALLAAVAVAALIYATRSTDPQRPPRQVPAEAPALDDPPLVREDAAARRTAKPDHAADRPTATRPTASPPAPALLFGTVDVQAVDDRTGDAILGCEWTPVEQNSGVEPTVHTSGSGIQLRVPIGRPVGIRLHHPEFAKSLGVDVSLLDGATHRAVIARLVRLASPPGISLRVVDVDGTPVQCIRVLCAAPPDDDPHGNAWQEQWTRESTALDGVHALAIDRPGRHRLRVTALEPSGRPRLLLPITHLATLDGATRRAHDIAFEAAAGSIVVRRSAGTTLTLADANGRAVAARWSELERTTSSTRVELVEPIPAGDYEIESRNAGAVSRRRVRVDAGLRTFVDMQ